MSRCGARLKRGFFRSIADTRGLDIEARERFISRNRGPFPTGPSLHPFPLAHARGDPFAAIRYRSDTRCISAATTFLLPLLARWKRMAVCGRVGRRGPVEWLKTISRPDAAMGTGSEKMIRNEVARDGISVASVSIHLCGREISKRSARCVSLIKV